GFRRKKFLQDIRRALSFQSPHFHFSEPLAAKLGLTAERLLCDERIRTNRASVDLVIDQVGKLEHVNVADGYGLFEHLAGHTVEEIDFSGKRQARLFQVVLDFVFGRAVEDRRRERNSIRQRPGKIENLLVIQIIDSSAQGTTMVKAFDLLAKQFRAGLTSEEATN